MRTPFDQFAKHLLEQALAPSGEVLTETEIAPDVQRADVWYMPDATIEARRSDPGLLARMATGPSLFEPFHEAPDVGEVMGCLRKLLTVQYSAQGRERWRARPDHPPTLWMITAGRPDTALHALGMTRLRGWPPGIYAPAAAWRARIVVIPELPRTRETLLVRLMGAGHVLRDAIKELRALPSDASERGVVFPALVVLHEAFPAAEDRTDEQRELAMTTMEIYENWRRRTLAEGEARGKAEGEAEALLRVCARRGLTLTADETARVRACTDRSTLDAWLDRAATATTAGEVFV